MIIVTLVFSTLINLSGYKFVNEVFINGDSIGFAKNKEEIYLIIDEIKKENAFFEKEGNKKNKDEYKNNQNFFEEIRPIFLNRILNYKNLTSKDALKFNLLSKIDKMIFCYSFCFNDIPEFGVSTLNVADNILKNHKKKFIGDEISDDSVLEFDKKISIEKRFLPTYKIKNFEEALDILSKNECTQITHTCNKNDTLEGLAIKNNTSVDEIIKSNKNLGKNIFEGQKIYINKNGPFLGVRLTKKIEYTEEIPFNVKNIEDEKLKEGNVNIVSPGVNGKNKIYAKIVFQNGNEISREILKKENLKEAKEQIQKIGKEKTPTLIASGNFSNPTGGRLTSRFGMRWGRQHMGIDIGGPIGTNVRAADNGIIKFASWRNGYGYYILIDHQNGYETGYGHNCQILVKVGQKVSKGDVISKMGSTGRSTGSHLHFEIKKNGVFIDPLKYVNY
jgi:murein DD-endopeptidase MepM/ murein hydrolase activator NlpD